MKKILLLTIALLFCFTYTVFASDAQRQIASPLQIDARMVKATPGKVYKVTMIASTGTYAWVAVYDSASQIALAAEDPKIEIREAVQYNTVISDFDEGFNFYEGIYVESHNASYIINYY